MRTPGFRDRSEAGLALANALTHYKAADPVVVGLTRGGVPVAFEVARALDADLDICIVRKIGAPVQPEFGIGAVAEGGVVVFDDESVATVGATPEELTALAEQKLGEVESRVRLYRRNAPPMDLRGRTVIVVDDGLATGGTARAALRAIRKRGARYLVLALPVAAADSIEGLRSEADDVVCLHAPRGFSAVGVWYGDFRPTGDDEVVELLARGRQHQSKTTASSESSRAVHIPVGTVVLDGYLACPAGARGIVLFAHGSGSGRNSPRNQLVARELRAAGLATLLFDLLTEEEERRDAVTGELRFDVVLLAERLVAATDWVRARADTAALPIGYFGASTGAAAALIAAAERSTLVDAVVSRGGRPDLASQSLSEVKAATLLIVGGADREVLELNRQALGLLRSEKQLVVVQRATHLFEEPGALEAVGRTAATWFTQHLGTVPLRATA